MADEPKSRLNALDNDRRSVVRMSLADQAYSAIIKRLRWALPFIVLGILTALMIWPKVAMEISERRFEPTKVDRATLEKAAKENRLMNAVFSSVDAKGRPFSIVAAEAIQDIKNPDRITLSAPNGKMKIDDTIEMTAESANGVYMQKDQVLTLLDGVVLTRSDGTVMTTKTLLLNLMSNDASTQDAVEIAGPQGTLSAQGMLMRDNGAVTIFSGPATLTLTPKNSIDPQEGTP